MASVYILHSDSHSDSHSTSKSYSLSFTTTSAFRR